MIFQLFQILLAFEITFAYILHVRSDEKSNKKLMLHTNFTNDFQLTLLVLEACFIFLNNTCVILL